MTRTHRLRCPECKAKTTAELPGELGGSAFGPRLQAAVVTMSARNRISRREMSELAGELFGLEMSVGAVDAVASVPRPRFVSRTSGSPRRCWARRC
jgi:transposase